MSCPTEGLFFYFPSIPFIFQEELEHLNEASAEINRLELQLDVSKVCFQTASVLYTCATQFYSLP